MSAAIIIAIAVVAVLAVIVVAVASRRRDSADVTGHLSRETRERDRSEVSAEATSLVGAPSPLGGKAYERSVALERLGGANIEPVRSSAPVVYVPPDAETIGVNRRQFLNRSIVGLMSLSLASFGAACVAFLWPPPKGGFGSKIRVGTVDDIRNRIRSNNGFLYVPEGRMWVTEYPADKVAQAEKIYAAPVVAGMAAGFVALWQTCPHLGCRVPECKSSQWFECPCHGSKYNRVGEKRGGPAPRGMDRFAAEVDPAGNFIVNTGARFQGPAIGTDTTGQNAEGPNCIGQAAPGGHSA